jgi:hypothetical protein
MLLPVKPILYIREASHSGSAEKASIGVRLLVAAEVIRAKATDDLIDEGTQIARILGKGIYTSRLSMSSQSKGT